MTASMHSTPEVYLEATEKGATISILRAQPPTAPAQAQSAVEGALRGHDPQVGCYATEATTQQLAKQTSKTGKFFAGNRPRRSVTTRV